MALLHVQQLNSENVCRAPKFLGGEEKWRRLMLYTRPPFHHSGDARQLWRSHRPQNAENVQIGVRLVKIAARRGAVQEYRLEIVPSCFVQPFDQVFQCLVHIAHCRFQYSSELYQLPDAPPPPLLPPPKPPNPPPPE